MAPSHYLVQWCIIIGKNFRNIFLRSFNRNPNLILIKTRLKTAILVRPQRVNTLRPRPNGRYFADDTFKCIFLNENAWILLKISLKFVPKVQINNIRALVLIMAWRRSGDKPLSEPMMVRLPTHICVTRPQWVKRQKLSMNVTLLNDGYWSTHYNRRCFVSALRPRQNGRHFADDIFNCISLN